MNRIAAAVVLVLGVLVLAASATGVVLELRSEGGGFPSAQILLALVVAVGMSRAIAIFRREQHER